MLASRAGAGFHGVPRVALSTNALRSSFLEFFEENGHIKTPSSSLIPHNDPSLLFTNAGMVPMKKYFVGDAEPPAPALTSAQCCLRVSGKHNDFDNVGRTARHHTFFEMLGNFAFNGHLSQRDAIALSWRFLTQTLGLPKDRLAVSVFETDEVAAEHWRRDHGIAEDRIFRLGREDNYWTMGASGPAGPCSEIFWKNDDEWLEIWNLVFMQDLLTEGGDTVSLPSPAVDTGMGLERLASVMQGVQSNYETDVLAALVNSGRESVLRRTGQDVPYSAASMDPQSVALRIIADHARAASFLIADGLLPSNVGRGYVLRRIIRRAIRAGALLDIREPFLADTLPTLLEHMGAIYPSLQNRAEVIARVISIEEKSFQATLESGMAVLEAEFSKNDGVVPGSVAFYLHDTFGFPIDITTIIAAERGRTVDTAAFTALMEEQQERSRAHWVGAAADTPSALKTWQQNGVVPVFTGHTHTEMACQVVAVEESGKGTTIAIDPCPFYAESGGQVGDQGRVRLSDGTEIVVENTTHPYEGGIALHVPAASRPVTVGDEVVALVDAPRRHRTAVHHTATHLMHAALRGVLGGHVSQAGSLVSPEKLRFDFTHDGPLTPEEIKAIVEWIKDASNTNTSVETVEATYAAAVAEHDALANMALSDKYGQVVRVVKMAGLSSELCGGTHVENTSELFPFVLTGQSAVANGVRRVEAMAGKAAVEYLLEQHATLENIASSMHTNLEGVTSAVKNVRKIARHSGSLKSLVSSGDIGIQATATGEVGGGTMLVYSMPPAIESLDLALQRDIVGERAKALAASDPHTFHCIMSGKMILVSAGSGASKAGGGAGNVLQTLLRDIDGGRGGGSVHLAQGRLSSSGKAQAVLDWLSRGGIA